MSFGKAENEISNVVNYKEMEFVGLLIQNDSKKDKNLESIDNFNGLSTERQEKIRNLVGEWKKLMRVDVTFDYETNFHLTGAVRQTVINSLYNMRR